MQLLAVWVLTHGALMPWPRMQLGDPALLPSDAAIGPSLRRATTAAVGGGVRRMALRTASMAENYGAKIAELLQRTGRISPSVR